MGIFVDAPLLFVFKCLFVGYVFHCGLMNYPSHTLPLIDNVMMNLCSALTAYCFFGNKPACLCYLFFYLFGVFETFYISSIAKIIVKRIIYLFEGQTC